MSLVRQVPTQESLRSRRQSFQRRRKVENDDVQIHIDADAEADADDDIEILELYQQVTSLEVSRLFIIFFQHFCRH
jgi:hypothetical protein